MTYEVVAASIIGKNANGLLIDLHFHDFITSTDAAMYYAYLSLFFVCIFAGFASQSNEGRYAFATPLLAAFFVWVGWLSAPSPSSYWGSIVFLLLFGAFIYMNDANREKNGTGGPGQKLITIAVMTMVFSACFGLVATGGLIPFTTTYGSSSNTMCNTAYQCDEGGNIMLSASVSRVSNAGGATSDVLSTLAALANLAVYMLLQMIILVGSILFVSVVIYAAYPVIATSSQAVAFLTVVQLAIWVIYFIAFWQWWYKPGIGQGDV